MNPLEYWYNTNIELRKFLDIYFYENIEKCRNHGKLKANCENLYRDGNAVEKNQVLTLLSALKNFF